MSAATVVPLRLRAWPPKIKDNTFAMLAKKGIPFLQAQQAYRRWREASRPEPCRFGREQAIAVDCNCEGCLEKLQWLLFDWVTLKFAPRPGDPTAPTGVPT